MSIAGPRIEDLGAVKSEWLARLDSLVSLVKGWVEASGWRAELDTKPVTESRFGRYDVPILIMTRGDVEVILSPLALVIPSPDGRVDLYLMPGYDDLATIDSKEGAWFIHDTLPRDRTAPPPVFGGEVRPLDERAIYRVLDAIRPHA